MIRVNRLEGVNSLVFRQDEGDRFFIATNTRVIISISTLAAILKFLVFNEYISIKILEEILSEYYEFLDEDGPEAVGKFTR